MTLSEIQTAFTEAVVFGVRLARVAYNFLVQFRRIWCKVVDGTVTHAHHLINLNFGGWGSRAAARTADIAKGYTVLISKEIHEAYHQLLNKILQLGAGISGNTAKIKVLQKLASGEVSSGQLKGALILASGIVDASCFGAPGYTYLTPRLIKQFAEQGF
jgi:hypothetical protein